MDSDERFTPPEVIAFRDAMWTRGTDTDPAWNPRSFSTARHTYTKRNNGLVMPWFGRVWLNPPWSDPAPWLARLIWHLRQMFVAGCDAHLPEGMLCVRNDPSTAWWSLAWKNADAIAFLSERTRYWQVGEDGELEMCGTPTFTSVVFYFGAGVARFLETAAAHGHYAMGLTNHSIGRRMEAMAKSKKPLPGDVLGEMVRDTIAQYARAHPELTLAEVVNMIPSDGAEELLMSLQVRDLWPHDPAPKQAAAPKHNGANGHAKRPRRVAPKPVAEQDTKPAKPAKPRALSPERKAAVASVVQWIGKGKLKEFTASAVMAHLKVSRQTALRTLAHVPGIQAEGRASSARYVVT